MPKKIKKTEKYKPFKQGIYSADLLRDKVYKKGDKVYFLLFSFSQPDVIKIFAGKVMRNKQNADFTKDYVIQITNAFEKREALKDFFESNWFRTAHRTHDIQQSDLNEGAKMFSFTDTDLVDEITNDKLKYGEYKTFFKNHAEKFNFWVNETFMFDDYKVAMTYMNKMAVMSVCSNLKTIHDITTSKHLRQGGSSVYTKTTQEFIRKHKLFILDLIHELGPTFWHFKEDNHSLYTFFEEYILDRKMRSLHFNKWRREKLKRWSQHDLDRENETD